MSAKKISLLLLVSFLFSFSTSYAAYQEVTCSTNPVFTSNGCGQCFTGGGKLEWDNLGFLSDDWINATTGKQILYKEEQKMPYMVNLGGNASSWVQTPASTDFWDWTPEFNALYDAAEEGYVLPAGQKVTWLKSKIGYAFSLEKNSAPAGSNIGMLIYTIKPHNISADGQVTIADTAHNECVLFTSAAKSATPATVAEKPKALPKTGPENIILIALALLLGFGFIRYTKKA